MGPFGSRGNRLRARIVSRNNHRGTENTEGAQRKSLISLCTLCVLCVSVVIPRPGMAHHSGTRQFANVNKYTMLGLLPSAGEVAENVRKCHVFGCFSAEMS